MKKAIVAFVLALAVTQVFQEGPIVAASGKGAPQTKCPVMGSDIDGNIYQDFKERYGNPSSLHW
jgi:hypothetical protein